MRQDTGYHNHQRKNRLFLFLVLILLIGGILLYLHTLNSSRQITPIPIAVPTASSSPSTTLNYNLGMSLGDTLVWKTPAEINSELDDIASLGIGRIRFDISWADIQPESSTTFDWYKLDQIVSAANARKIKLLPDLAYTPKWERPSDCTDSDECAPADPAQFAIFAQAVVSRYAPQGISDWEIWNEENTSGFWKPVPNASAYAKLLKYTYSAIKSVESSSIVIMGGLSPTPPTSTQKIAPVDFLTQIYATGAKDYFDAVGMHPYSSPTLPTTYEKWNAWSQMSLTVPSLRSIMGSNGDGNKQIWLTEFGAPTGGPGILEASNTDKIFTGSPDHVTEALQAEMYSTAITSAKQLPWAGPLFFYSYKDLGTSTKTPENFFGIIRNDGSLKPAYDVLKQAASQ